MAGGHDDVDGEESDVDQHLHHLESKLAASTEYVTNYASETMAISGLVSTQLHDPLPRVRASQLT